MADRAAITQVGSLRRTTAGWKFNNWTFDGIIAQGVRPIATDEYGELTHVAGWSIGELQSIARDHSLLSVGLVRPEDFS